MHAEVQASYKNGRRIRPNVLCPRNFNPLVHQNSAMAITIFAWKLTTCMIAKKGCLEWRLRSFTLKSMRKKLTYSWRRKIVSEKVLETSVTWLEKRKKKNIVEIWPSSYETQSKSALTPSSQDYPPRKYLFIVVEGASYEIFRVFQIFWTVLRLFNLFLSICIAFVNFFNYTTVLVVIFVNKEF